MLELFDNYFKVRHNVIFEHARFKRCVQQPGETAEDFIMALYTLAAMCEYCALESEMIRDRLVVSIQDHALSERQQTDAKLTLETAKTQVRQRKSIHEQQKTLKGVKQGKRDNLDSVYNSRSSIRPDQGQR